MAIHEEWTPFGKPKQSDACAWAMIGSGKTKTGDSRAGKKKPTKILVVAEEATPRDEPMRIPMARDQSWPEYTPFGKTRTSDACAWARIQSNKTKQGAKCAKKPMNGVIRATKATGLSSMSTMPVPVAAARTSESDSDDDNKSVGTVQSGLSEDDISVSVSSDEEGGRSDEEEAGRRPLKGA